MSTDRGKRSGRNARHALRSSAALSGLSRENSFSKSCAQPSSDENPHSTGNPLPGRLRSQMQAMKFANSKSTVTVSPSPTPISGQSAKLANGSTAASHAKRAYGSCSEDASNSSVSAPVPPCGPSSARRYFILRHSASSRVKNSTGSSPEGSASAGICRRRRVYSHRLPAPLRQQLTDVNTESMSRSSHVRSSTACGCGRCF